MRVFWSLVERYGCGKANQNGGLGLAVCVRAFWSLVERYGCGERPGTKTKKTKLTKKKNKKAGNATDAMKLKLHQ